MCACRLEANSNQSTPVNGLSPQHTSTGVDLEELEDLYPYLEMDRTDTGCDTEDVYTQLAQKERDLILAAELGKALLEKNEELNKNNEQIHEEFNKKLEELTQEKYELRLQLETIETEYSNTVKELQNDVNHTRRELEEEREHARQAEKTKSQIIHELTQQNERLTEQLRKASHQEENLESQLSTLREQMHSRRSNMHDHVQQLEVLRAEINMVTERKSDLERRIGFLSEERDTLSVNLEDAQDRIFMIEKQKRDLDQQIRNQEREISELREQNTQLQDKLENMSLQATNSVFDQSTNSLFNELEMSQLSTSMSTDSLDNVGLSNGSVPTGNGHLNGSRLSRSLTLAVPGITLTASNDEDVECDGDIDDIPTNTGLESLSTAQLMAMLRSPEGDEDDISIESQEDDDNYQLNEEALQVYEQLHEMVLNLSTLRGKEWCMKSLKKPNIIKKGNLLSVVKDLQDLLAHMDKPQLDQLSPHRKLGKMDTLEDQVKVLQLELRATRRQVEKLKGDLVMKDQEIEKRMQELTELTGKISLQHQEFLKMQEERDQLQDEAAGITVNRDEIVDQARKDRDDAIAKKNDLEVELAKTKLDLMHLDSQLMEAIQQKIGLSQQLEQWELDMHELLDMQLTKRIQQEETSSAASSRSNTPPTRKRLTLPWT